jgi:hypothetical protein
VACAFKYGEAIRGLTEHIQYVDGPVHYSSISILFLCVGGIRVSISRRYRAGRKRMAWRCFKLELPQLLTPLCGSS